jgi:hypothetical protein
LNRFTGKYDLVTGAIYIADMSVRLGYFPKDPAEVTSDAAFDADTDISVREVDNDGNTFYYVARIISRERDRVEGNEVKRKFTFSITRLVTVLV